MYLFRKFLQISYPEKVLLLKAVCLLLFVKFIVFIFPLRLYKKLLGEQNIPLNVEISDNTKHLIYKISNAVVRARKILKWKNQCLTEAITAKVLLKRYGLNSTLFLGVRKENNKLAAHAWLCYGSLFVTGRKGMQNFTVISSFT